MYFILKNEEGNSKYDFYVDGTLFQEDGSLAINYFDIAKPIASKVGKHLTIKLDEKYSNIQRIRDRIVTRVQKSFYILVVSPQVKKLLENLDVQNVEYLNLTIKGKTIEVSDYYIVNVLSKIDCVDDEKSEVYHYSKTDRTIHSIYGITMNEEKIPNHLNIFLMDRHKGGVIVVHQRLKLAIEKQGLTGFKFIRPEEFAL